MFKIRIEELRNLMAKYKLDGYLVPISDEYQTEFPDLKSQRLQFLTGFSGSSGILIVLQSRCLFLTDSRYTAQCALELDQEIFEIYQYGDFIDIPEDLMVGYDPSLFTKLGLKMIQRLGIHNAKAITENLVDQIWQDKPNPDCIDPWKYSEVKNLQLLFNHITQQGANHMLITDHAALSWLLGIRSYDTPYSCAMLSRAIVSSNKIKVFSEKRSLDGLLEHDLIECYDIKNWEPEINNLSGKVLLDQASCPAKFVDLVSAKCEIVYKDNIINHWKAVKTQAEIEAFKEVHIIDGACICEFLAWLEEEIENGNKVTEYQAGQKLSKFRKEGSKRYLCDSFSVICGYRENGAIVHYSSKEESSKVIDGRGILLVDSGGHYLGGTTDITRTINIGQPTSEQKFVYTKVLQGHIDLAMLKFPKGIRGAHIDVLARRHLWMIGKDYGHGTGHGVGDCLNVHEGPQSISLNSQVPLEVGMVLSNEPGFYSESEYGIRIENLVFINEIGNGFLEFHNLTLVPYCKELIERERLNNNQIDYINSYQDQIQEKIVPLLSMRAKKWIDKNMF
jgi:Xaa-Pro aminopeptidase